MASVLSVQNDLFAEAENPPPVNVTIPVGTTAALLFCAAWRGVAPGPVLTSATLASAAPDFLESNDAEESAPSLAIWLNPPSGTQSLDPAFSAWTSELVCTLVCVDGVTGVRDYALLGPADAMAGAALTTESGDFVIAQDVSDGQVAPNQTDWTSHTAGGPYADGGYMYERVRSIVAAGASVAASAQRDDYPVFGVVALYGGQGVVGTSRIINDSHAANPGAIPLGSEVPVGAQIALVFARWAAAGVDSPLNALDASFGDATILGSSDEPSSHCAFAYIEIDDWGSDHTISPSFLVDTQTPNVRRVFDLVFLSGLDTSSLGNWLRDWDFDRSGASTVASVEIDTEEDDIVLAALGQWEGTPDEPPETTTLIDPETTGNNRVRLVQLDEPESGTATLSTGTSFPSVVAVSVFFADGPVALEGHATGSLAGSASLAKGVSLVGAAVAAAVGTGGVSHSVPLSGAATAAAGASADLETQAVAALEGHAISGAIANGMLALEVRLGGGALAGAVAQAQMEHAVRLMGGAAASLDAIANLSIDVTLSGNAVGQIAASAELSTAKTLAGEAAASAAAAGTLQVSGVLTGAAVAGASGGGALDLQVPLAGTAQAGALGAASLEGAADLAGNAAVGADAAATLSLQVPLTAQAVAHALAGGELALRVNLQADAVAQAIAGGNLAILANIELAGSALTGAMASAALDTGLALPPLTRGSVTSFKARSSNIRFR